MVIRYNSMFRMGWILALVLSNAAQVIAQNPTIEYIDKTSTFVGDMIIIAGSGFDDDPSKLKVFFGAAPATIISSTQNLIEVNLPAGSTFNKVTVTHLTSGLTGFSDKSVLLSFGGSTFDETKVSAPSDFASADLYDLCICDFDGDGKDDVATTNNSTNLISILRNTSTAGVVSFATTNISVNSPTINVKCADLNGDGKPEIVLSKSGSPGDRIFYLKNNSTSGNINFSPAAFALVNGAIARRVDVRDLDLDGKPEVIVTNQANNFVTILKNTSTVSTISFAPIVSLTFNDPDVSQPPNSAGLVVEDFNNDGLPDIAVSPFLEKNIYFLPNNSTPGNLSFGSSQKMTVAGNLVNLAAADLDGDGKPELLATKLLGNAVSIFKNELTDGATDFLAFTETEITVNARPWGLDIGDINGDGLPDIAVASIDNAVKSLSFLENNSTPGDIQMTVKFIATPETTRNIRVGDINGDGKPDFVFTSIDNFMVSVIINQNCVEPAVTANSLEHCVGSDLLLKTPNALEAEFVWYKDNIEVKRSDEAFYEETAGAGGTFLYKVEVIGEGGACVNESSPISIDVIPGTIPNPPPIVNPGPLCEGETLTLTVGNTPPLPGDATFLWTLPDGTTQAGNPLNVSGITIEDVGRYKLNISSGGCQSADLETLVEIISVPEFRVGASNGIKICQGVTTELSIPSDALYTYQWKKDGADITGATNNTLDVTTAGSYTVEITTPSMCTLETEPSVVEVVPEPVPSFDLPATGCINTDIAFQNTSQVQNNITVEYLWNFGDGDTSTDMSPTHQFATSGTYNVNLTVTYPDFNCQVSSIESIDIVDPPTVSIQASGDLSFCEGGSVDLSVTGTFASVLWSTLEATNSITVSQSGTYTVEVTTSDNCTVAAQEDVTVTPAPAITVTASDTVIQLGESAQLMATGADTYTWTPAGSLDNPDIANPLATPDTTTVYVVEGTDALGCKGTAQIKIRIDLGGDGELPVTPMKVFSPNGDTIDDFWRINNIESFPDCSVIIYNRGGKKIYEKKGYSQDWNARLNGKELPEEVYYFIIVCDDQKMKSGSILVVR